MAQSSDTAVAGSARADRELVDSLAHDSTALGVLYDRYAGLVYGIALAALRNPEDAQDLTQEIFVSLHRQRDGYDAAWAKRIQAARERGRVLRYRVVASRRKIAVGRKLVDLMSPTGSLQGTDNQFSFTTLRYRESPLVITGPGAGPAVTAGGILNDVLQLARG